MAFPPLGHYYRVDFDASLKASLEFGIFLRPLGWGFKEVSGIESEIEIDEVKEGGQNLFVHRLPGRVKFKELELKRGLETIGITAPIAQWCIKTMNEGITSKKGITTIDITVSLLNVSGLPIAAWQFYRAYPISWKIEDFNSMEDEVVIESITFSFMYMRRLTGGVLGAISRAANIAADLADLGNVAGEYLQAANNLVGGTVGMVNNVVDSAFKVAEVAKSAVKEVADLPQSAADAGKKLSDKVANNTDKLLGTDQPAKTDPSKKPVEAKEKDLSTAPAKLSDTKKDETKSDPADTAKKDEKKKELETKKKEIDAEKKKADDEQKAADEAHKKDVEERKAALEKRKAEIAEKRKEQDAQDKKDAEERKKQADEKQKAQEERKQALAKRQQEAKDRQDKEAADAKKKNDETKKP